MEPRHVDATYLIGPREAARRLGVARKTVYDWKRSGRLPHYKIGSKVRFDPADIEAFILATRVEATE